MNVSVLSVDYKTAELRVIEKIYFNHKGFVKLTIALAKGKKKHDKRASIKDKEWGINKQRLIKNRSL